MRKLSVRLFFAVAAIFAFTASNAFAENSVKITEPAAGAMVSGNVKVCLAANGVTVEPAKNGVNAGKGHHHLLIDADLPADLSKPIAKDDQHVHMGDGSTCKELKLAPGKHTIRALFATGDHVPYNPALTDSVEVTIK
ncbi:MAG: DUF4399 domain-containing protein [Nitrospinae bacterium]|nr:DUF4399 domain-containing protein [Nitrospinota bacterium]